MKLIQPDLWTLGDYIHSQPYKMLENVSFGAILLI